jgi:hypothetical protein
MNINYRLIGDLYSKGIKLSYLVSLFNISPFLIKSEMVKLGYAVSNKSNAISSNKSLDELWFTLSEDDKDYIKDYMVYMNKDKDNEYAFITKRTINDAFDDCKKEYNKATLLDLTLDSKTNFKAKFNKWSGIIFESDSFDGLYSKAKGGLQGSDWELSFTLELERPLQESDFERCKKVLNVETIDNINGLGVLTWIWN